MVDGEYIADIRQKHGFLTPDEVCALGHQTANIILAPESTLISRSVILGSGNIIYPGAIIECEDSSHCRIGDRNIIRSGCVVRAESGGSVSIGNCSQLGDGGAQVKANRPGATISIGNGVRIINGVELLGVSNIGDGAQLIGNITAVSVTLEGGGDYQFPDPDGRGAVIKGAGSIRNTRVGIGEVINGYGDLNQAPIERQRDYHPDAPRLTQ
jgi:carbonic anhydrase/acetyltransferase-like protein (isoleucine patch superfamily)